MLVILPSPHLGALVRPPLPPKYCEPRSVPQLFTLPLFSFQTHIWVNQGAWEHVIGASKHMTSHGKWFKDIRDLKTSRFVQIGNDTTHPITQIGKVSLSMQDGQTKYLNDVLYVPKITKKTIFVGQMVKQGLHVTFNLNGCFVEDMKNQGKFITKGKGMDGCSPLMWTCLRWIPCYSHMERHWKHWNLAQVGLSC